MGRSLREENDRISTLISSDYICFLLDSEVFTNINEIKLLNATGETYYLNNGLSLKFDSNYFVATEEFRKTYNEYGKDNDFSQEEDAKLGAMYEAINKENPNIKKTGSAHSVEALRKQANKEALIFVLLYFIWIYVLGDFLVGKRYIWKFICFIFRKIKDKIKKPDDKEVLAVGNNFYSQVTFEIENSDLLEEDVIISYDAVEKEREPIKVILMKANGYKKKERVRGGKYKLTSYECERFNVLGLPAELEVKGYTMKIKLKVEKNEQL